MSDGIEWQDGARIELRLRYCPYHDGFCGKIAGHRLTIPVELMRRLPVILADLIREGREAVGPHAKIALSLPCDDGRLLLKYDLAGAAGVLEYFELAITKAGLDLITGDDR